MTGSFCLVALWFAAVNGWETLGIVLLSASVHELGHYLVLRCFGAKISSLRLNALGIVMEADRRHLSYGQEMLAVLAGPIANFLCALGLTAVNYEKAYAFIGANIILGIFNLLPVRPLDGGRFLSLMLSWKLGPTAGEYIARGVGALLAGGLAVVLIYIMEETRGSLWLIPPMVGFLSISYKECCGK